VILSLARRCLLATALALLFVPCAARAAESPSYTAYFQGRYLTALKLAEQEAAQGSKEAFTLMGEIYEEGLGVAQDFGKAADNYAKAADLGDANAQFSLGALVAEGRGVKKDLRIAADLFERAAQAGNAYAQYNLALIYLNGKGRPQDRPSRGMDAKSAAGGSHKPGRSSAFNSARRPDRQG
jgi:TPR repeat protein